MKIKYYLILVILLFIFGCEQVSEQPVEEKEEKGTGILVVESVPADADLFINNVDKGKTPLTLYNFDVGSYDIIIKKEGYEDYISIVEIEAGKKREIKAYLNEVKKEIVEEKKVEEGKIEMVEEKEEGKEEVSIDVLEEGTVDIGEGIIKYCDFSEKKFTDKLTISVDVFSRRYPSHLVFTRYSNVDVKVIDKNINEVKKEDCVDILGSFGLLNSGQTLCVNTKEGYIVALGGTWKETEGSTLTWKMFD